MGSSIQSIDHSIYRGQGLLKVGVSLVHEAPGNAVGGKQDDNVVPPFFRDLIDSLVNGGGKGIEIARLSGPRIDDLDRRFKGSARQRHGEVFDTGAGGGQKIDYRLSSETHNDIMEMLYKGGIAGLILYLWLIWQVFRVLLARLRGNSDDVSHHLAVAGFSALAIYGIFIMHGGIYQILPMSYFAMLIGAVAAYRPQKAQISVSAESV